MITSNLRYLFLLFLFCVPLHAQSHQILQVGEVPLTAYSSAKGDSTYYLLNFYIPNPIKSSGSISIEFPIEYQDSFDSAPECGQISSQYISLSCTVSATTFKISMGEILQGNYEIVVGHVKNPSNFEISRTFKIYTYQSEALIDYNENFGKISFSNPPGI